MKLFLIALLFIPAIAPAVTIDQQIKELKKQGYTIEAYKRKGNLTFISYSKGSVLCKEYAAGAAHRMRECFTRTKR